MKINVLANKCGLHPKTQASYFIDVNVSGGIFASISKCKGNHNLLRLGYGWRCIPYEICIIYKTTIMRWENRLYCVLETSRRFQVQQFQRHQNTFVLSWHHNQYIFTFGILFHYHQTLSDRWTTHRRGGHHSNGLGRSCENCHTYASVHLIYELTYVFHWMWWHWWRNITRKRLNDYENSTDLNHPSSLVRL